MRRRANRAPSRRGARVWSVDHNRDWVDEITGFGLEGVELLHRTDRVSYAEVCIGFFRRLVRMSPRKVFLIIDRHPVHSAAAVARWLDKHEEQIRMFFLPGYSPELNPDELLNNDVKTNAVGRKRARNLAELKYNIRSFLWSTQKDREKVRRYFHAPQARYALD